MNTRIRELAEQAGFFPELNWDHTAWHAAGHDGTFEKFAQLIVRECAFVAQNKDAHKDWLKYGRGLAAGKILEHFGVEA